MQRQTNQKILILDFLKHTKTHPTAEEIYLQIKKSLPKISKSTVYRILEKLVDEEKIIKIASVPARFDGEVMPHAHFLCQSCGKVEDIKIKKEIFPALQPKNKKNNKIFINFVSLCEKCNKTEK